MHILTYKYVITLNENDILYIASVTFFFSLSVYHRYDMETSPRINEPHFFQCECTTVYLTNPLLIGMILPIFF